MKIIKNLSPLIFVSGLKFSKDLIISFGEIFIQFKDNIKLLLIHKKTFKELKNLNCPLENMKESYMYMESNHLEVFPFNGLIIKNTHRLMDTYLNITALDNNLDSLQNLQRTFEGSLCRISPIVFDINNFDLTFDKKFGSISLNFALDRINGGVNKIEEFMIKMKNILHDGGIVFGLSAPYIGLNHKKNALEYIKNKNTNQEWNNFNFSVNDLEKILKKHFDQYGLFHMGSCLIFRGIINKKPLDLSKYRPTLESLRGKHLKIQPEDFEKWVKNLDKFNK